MMLEITGSVKDRHLVEEYAVNIIKRFRLDRRKHGTITIRFRKRMPNGYGDSLGACEGDRRDADIDIAQKQSFWGYLEPLNRRFEIILLKMIKIP